MVQMIRLAGLKIRYLSEENEDVFGKHYALEFNFFITSKIFVINFLFLNQNFYIFFKKTFCPIFSKK